MTPGEWFAALPAAVPWAGGIILAIPVAVWFVKKAFPKLRQISHLVDDFVGAEARPGVPARPGIMERLQTIEAAQGDLQGDMALVKHEVMPNTGTSLNDAVRRTEARTDALEARLDEHVSTATTLINTLAKEQEKNE